MSAREANKELNRHKILAAARDLLPGGEVPKFSAHVLQSAATWNGLRTVLQYQAISSTRYFDTVGFPGRTVGLSAPGIESARN